MFALADISALQSLLLLPTNLVQGYKGTGLNSFILEPLIAQLAFSLCNAPTVMVRRPFNWSLFFLGMAS